MNVVLYHLWAHIGSIGRRELPENSEMNEMTLPFRHRIRNLISDGTNHLINGCVISPNFGLMLGHRRRRWPNINPILFLARTALVQRLGVCRNILQSGEIWYKLVLRKTAACHACIFWGEKYLRIFKMTAKYTKLPLNFTHFIDLAFFPPNYYNWKQLLCNYSVLEQHLVLMDQNNAPF